MLKKLIFIFITGIILFSCSIPTQNMDMEGNDAGIFTKNKGTILSDTDPLDNVVSIDDELFQNLEQNREPVYKNIAFEKYDSFKASSKYAFGYETANMVDGDITTGWGSASRNQAEWLYIDLGEITSVNGIGIKWYKDFYAAKYEVFTSDNAKAWNRVASLKKGNPGDNKFFSTSGTYECRYIALSLLTHNTNKTVFAITEFEVYQEIPKIITPVISPLSGEIDAGTEITITTETPDAGIYYTLDGENPTSLSLLYSETNKPVISIASRLKVIAIKVDMLDSEIVEVNYIISGISLISKRDMIKVPGGTFTQTDSSDTNSKFKHTVSSFEIGKYEVTYELWYTVYQWAISNGYAFKNTGREGDNGTDGAIPSNSNYEPVTAVSWNDVIVWCNAYSEMLGFEPCYYFYGTTEILKDSNNGTKCFNAVCYWSNNGYRLPSEGEWQYVAGYGMSPYTSYAYASGSTGLGNTFAAAVGWLEYNANNHTHAVGLKRANPLGAFDMSGNVNELCWDRVDYPLWYPSSPKTDYRGGSNKIDRITRGGSFEHTWTYLNVGYRGMSSHSSGAYYTGFRVARYNK